MKKFFLAVAVVFSIGGFLFSYVSDLGGLVNQTDISRRSINIQSSATILDLMGMGLENAPSFEEGLARFLEARNVKLSREKIDALSFFLLGNLSESNHLEMNGISKTDVEAFLQMTLFYADGIRRDQVDVGSPVIGGLRKILRFSEIKPLVNSIEQAIAEYQAEIGAFDSEIAELINNLGIAAQMVGFWVTAPISSRPMFEALLGGNTAVMAANTQMTVSVPGIFISSMEQEAPMEIEYAQSESNLEGGYTGVLAQDTYDLTTYYAFLLGYDLPWALHADHTTVSDDTIEKIDYALRQNQAQLLAGYTSFAEDPSSVPAVRESSQLAVLNGMYFSSFAIGNTFAQALSAHGEFKKMVELKPIIESIQLQVLNGYVSSLRETGAETSFDDELVEHGEFSQMKELEEIIKSANATLEEVGQLMDYIESQCGIKKDVDILTSHIESTVLSKVLNYAISAGYNFAKIFPDYVSEDLASRITQHGEFGSLSELEEICAGETVSIEGADAPVKVSDLIKTFLDLKRVTEINYILARPIPGDLGQEEEVGHIGAIDPITGKSRNTTPLEAFVLVYVLQNITNPNDFPDIVRDMQTLGLEALIKEHEPLNINLLAVNNGSAHGNVFVDGVRVNTTIEVDLTDGIARIITPLGVKLAQHGTTGTPFDLIKEKLAGLILKANVGTQWRNIALELMPEGLFIRMVNWTIENKGKQGQFEGQPSVEELLQTMPRAEFLNNSIYAQFISTNIKHATRIFKYEIDNMDPVYLQAIVVETQRVAAQYFDAFNAVGKNWVIIDYLGWGWEHH